MTHKYIKTLQFNSEVFQKLVYIEQPKIQWREGKFNFLIIIFKTILFEGFAILRCKTISNGSCEKINQGNRSTLYYMYIMYSRANINLHVMQIKPNCARRTSDKREQALINNLLMNNWNLKHAIFSIYQIMQIWS